MYVKVKAGQAHDRRRKGDILLFGRPSMSHWKSRMSPFLPSVIHPRQSLLVSEPLRL